MSKASKAATAALCAAFFFAAAPHPASAQETGVIPVPVVQVSAGYTFMRDFSDDLPEGVNFPAGWYSSGAVNLTRWLAVVGEATGSYKDGFDVSFDDLTFTNSVRVYTFMGGPRFFHQAGRVAPFAQVLAGAAQMRLRTTFPEALAPIGTISVTATDFAIQPGGGVTVFLTERVGLRLSADYRCIVDFVDGENDYANEFRLTTGFTFNWGSR